MVGLKDGSSAVYGRERKDSGGDWMNAVRLLVLYASDRLTRDSIVGL